MQCDECSCLLSTQFQQHVEDDCAEYEMDCPVQQITGCRFKVLIQLVIYYFMYHIHLVSLCAVCAFCSLERTPGRRTVFISGKLNNMCLSVCCTMCKKHYIITIRST